MGERFTGKAPIADPVDGVMSRCAVPIFIIFAKAQISCAGIYVLVHLAGAGMQNNRQILLKLCLKRHHIPLLCRIIHPLF